MKKILFSFLALSLFFVGGSVSASTAHNVTGYAWSDTIGWISFNNTNHTGTVSYGVNIEEDGNLTGYAWSSNIGWIHFDPSGPFPSGSYSAKVDLSTKELGGWARACSVFTSGCSGSLSANTGGWDGWISFSGSSPDYGVFVDDNGKFQNYAWGGGTVIGWISFSGSSPDYKVETTFPFIPTPVISNPSVPATADSSYCNQSRMPHSITWKNSADSIDPNYTYEYEIKFGSALTLTGEKSSIENITWNYTDLDPACSNKCCDNYSQINWGTNYTISIRGRNIDKSVSPQREGSWSTPVTVLFTAKNHCYPYVGGISNTPEKIEVDEIISFEPISAGIYSGVIGYNWAFPSANPSVSLLENPTTTFIEAGSKNIVFSVSDGTYSCSVTKPVSVQLPLPDWQETTPFGKVRMFFGSIVNGLFNKVAGF